MLKQHDARSRQEVQRLQRVALTIAYGILLAVAAPFTTPVAAFVLLGGQEKAHLDVAPENPIAIFRWDGNAPVIKEPGPYGLGEDGPLDDHAIMLGLIQKAMSVWNDVAGSYLVLEVEEDPNAAISRDDGINNIVVSSLDSATAAAAALPEIKDNLIADCDITLGSRTVSAKSLAYTILHELGHCLGLGHNHTNYEAVMGYSRASEALRLSLDDIAGITFLYPDPAVSNENPGEMISCGRIAPASSGRRDFPAGRSARSGEDSSLFWLILLLASPLAVACAAKWIGYHRLGKVSASS